MDIKYEVIINAPGYNELHFAFDKATSATDFSRLALAHTIDNAVVTIKITKVDEEAAE